MRHIPSPDTVLFTTVAMLIPRPRILDGKISDVTTQLIGPMPNEKNATNKQMPK